MSYEWPECKHRICENQTPVYIDRERPIKAGQTTNTSLNFIFSMSRFHGTRRAVVRSADGTRPGLQPIPNSNLPEAPPLSGRDGGNLPGAVGIGVCDSTARVAGVTSGVPTISDEWGDEGVAMELVGWEDVRRYEKGFGNIVKGEV